MDAPEPKATRRHDRTALRQFLTGFLKWWLHELVSLLPRRWQQRLARFEQMPLYLWRDTTLVPADHSQPSRQVSPIVVGLSAEQVQIIRLKLPAAIEPRLHQSLALQLARHTPFLPDQVLFDCIVEKRTSPPPLLEVVLAIVPKTQVAAILARAQEQGLVVGRLSVLQASAKDCFPLDFLAHGEKQATDKRSFWRHRGLLVILVLLMALGFPFWREYQAIQALQERVDALSTAALEAESLQKELKTLESRAGFLGVTRADTNSLAWLTELTRILPDSVWLTEVQRSGAEIRIVGEAADAFGLIGLVDASPRFEQSRFNAPMRRDGVREQFDLTAVITRGTPPVRAVQTEGEGR